MKYFFPTLFFITLVCCQKIDKNNVPEQLIPEDQMVYLLLDVAQIKAIKSNYTKHLKYTGITPNKYLCSKYDIDSITLNENLRYYSYEPSRLKKIYEKVLDSLDKSHAQIEDFIKIKEAAVNARKEREEQRKKDSIAEVKCLDSIFKSAKLKKEKNYKVKDSLNIN